MGHRDKAAQALAAWNGDRPTLGERAAASLPPPADDTPAPEDPPAIALPMPPPGATGSWAWVVLPEGSGTICARAVEWVRVTPDELSPKGLALRVSGPYWRQITVWTGEGGTYAGASEEHQFVPSSQATPIPGHWFGVPIEGQDQQERRV
jgi:hypothetical protein